MSFYHLTFDIDWAPDCCVEYILNKLKKQKIKSTFFITHETDIIDEIRKDGHSLGIHPNFLKDSTQGNSELEIVGIRPGEKLHEVMCPQDEYQKIIEFDTFFVIEPSIKFSIV